MDWPACSSWALCGTGADSNPTPVAVAAAATGATTLGFTPAPLEWSHCDDSRLQCATLEVPLDYDDPDGARIDLAVAMFPARGPEARVGVLVTNPGGPGNSGIDFLSGGGPFNDEINRRFDVVSWDPRGVGRSEPLECGTQIAELFLDADLAPVDSAGAAALAQDAGDAAAACEEANGALLGHVGTDEAVNDVEAIRLALGGEPLTYVGFSYGTSIGLRYAERFPTNLRAMALDGVIDPEHTLAEQMTTTAIGIDRSLAAVLAACTVDCPIDGDPVTAFRQLVEQARTRPLRTDDGREVAANAVVLAGMAVTYDDTLQRSVLRRHRRRPAGPRKPRPAVRRRLRRPVRPRLHRGGLVRRPATPDHRRRGRTNRNDGRSQRHRGPRASSAATSAPSRSPASTGQRRRPTPSSPSKPRRAPRSSSSATPVTTPPPTTRPNGSQPRSRTDAC